MSNLQAVADRRRGTRVRWSRPRPSVETNSLIEVALHGSSDVDPRPLLTKPVHKAVYPLWSTRDGRYTVSPCQWCHGAVLARMTIDEPFGYVCLNSACRRDSAGVIWPADGFDRYVAFPDRWIAAGVNLVDAIPESVPTRGRRGWAPRKKRLSALTPNAVEAILRDYRERLPVRAIVKKHNLKDAHDVYWLLKEAKEPLLRFPDRHPR